MESYQLTHKSSSALAKHSSSLNSCEESTLFPSANVNAMQFLRDTLDEKSIKLISAIETILLEAPPMRKRKLKASLNQGRKIEAPPSRTRKFKASRARKFGSEEPQARSQDTIRGKNNQK